MSSLHTWIEATIAALAGVGLGVAAALWGPLLVALVVSHDPIHSGPYLEAMQVLLLLLPILAGSLLAILVIKKIHYRGERVFTWIGLLSLLHLIVVWFLFLGS